jgi:hypothetical protein
VWNIAGPDWKANVQIANRLQRAQRLLKVSKQKDYYKVGGGFFGRRRMKIDMCRSWAYHEMRMNVKSRRPCELLSFARKAGSGLI